MVILLFVIVLVGILGLVSLFGSQRGAASSAAATSDKPNFVVFVTDDLDARTMQVMLDNGLLPNIKSKIVDGAADFRNAFVPCSICSPSRATILTGRYPHNHGVWHVLGSEGPQQFDAYLTRTANAYLPTWLGSDYYRAFVGRYHLGNSQPNWDYFVPVDGYDLRPGNYKAREGGVDTAPLVYQTRYIGETAKKAVRASGSRPLFLMVATTSAHANVANWRQLGTLSESTFGGRPVAFAQFMDEPSNRWRQHLVTANTAGGSHVHKWWERNSATRDIGWGAWTQTGDDASITPNTGTGSVAGWNVLSPSSNVKRQQLVKTTRQEIGFYSRDITSGQPVPAWVKTADTAFLNGTGVLAVAGWAAIEFPSGLIRQQVIRGDEFYGYMSWVKYRLPSGATTDWRVDPDWGENVVFGRVTGFNLIHTSGARFLVQVLFQPPGTDRFEWWQSPELTDFQELAVNNNAQGSVSGPAAGQGIDEGAQYLSPVLKYQGQSYTVEPGPDNSRNVPGGQPVDIAEIHPYYLMRAHAEGSWSPITAGQTYNWGGQYPAGSLRRNGDVNGFEAKAPGLDLPASKASFNRQLESNLAYYSTETWPDLNQTVWSLRRQQDYMRRLHLDRMEQLITMDRMVGEVLDMVGSNTIIIFTSDNGHYTGEHRLSNKLTPHEESIRVPLYIKTPGGTKRTVDRLVANIDLAPTILDYLGKAWHSAAYGVDGRSLKGLVESSSVTSWRRSLLMEFHRPVASNIPPVGTDWRFGLPDYLGLRVAQDAGGNSANTLYVQYYRVISDLNSAYSFERYFLNTDPEQTDNVAAGMLPALDVLIRDYYVASGRDCRVMDIKRVP